MTLADTWRKVKPGWKGAFFGFVAGIVSYQLVWIAIKQDSWFSRFFFEVLWSNVLGVPHRILATIFLTLDPNTDNWELYILPVTVLAVVIYAGIGAAAFIGYSKFRAWRSK